MSNNIGHENDNLSTNDNNELTKFKQTDKNFHVIYRLAPFERKGITTYKQKKISVYTSGDIGSRIRNAETGEHYNYKVGSKYENLFFSVRISSGECNGKYILPTLFFTSPKHYESYLHNIVGEETIDNWNYKRDILINGMNEKKYGDNVLVR